MRHGAGLGLRVTRPHGRAVSQRGEGGRGPAQRAARARCREVPRAARGREVVAGAPAGAAAGGEHHGVRHVLLRVPGPGTGHVILGTRGRHSLTHLP